MAMKMNTDRDNPQSPDICPHCEGPINVRNPKGFCDHLCYPDNCKVCTRIRKDRAAQIKKTKPKQPTSRPTVVRLGTVSLRHWDIDDAYLVVGEMQVFEGDGFEQGDSVKVTIERLTKEEYVKESKKFYLGAKK